MKKIFLLCFITVSLFTSHSQEADSTKTSLGEYPYVLPFLGQGAYDRGYELPLPFNVSIGSVYNKQGILLDNFQVAFTQGDEQPDYSLLQPIADLLEFGASEGRINTLFVRAEAWVLPFLSVGFYYGSVWGDQTIVIDFPISLETVTDIEGSYYGFNIAGFAPIGPVVLQADYSRSWTTNVRLDNPVRVNVLGTRIIKRFVSKKRSDRHLAVWAGAQFQSIESRTSGQINLGEALGITEEKIEEFENNWDAYTMTPEWDALPPGEKVRQTAAYNLALGGMNRADETTVWYEFDKGLENPMNMLIGFQYQLNKHWSGRAEYGFLQSKQQLFFNLVYYFGI